MTDGDALLAAILAAPEDDTPRLILADWLDDHGDAERAAFIRVGVELARLGSCGRDFSAGLSCHCRFCNAGGVGLRARERELFDAHSREWFGVDGPHGFAVGINTYRRPTDPEVLGIVSRGFVSEWRGPLSRWVGCECGRCGGTGDSGGELWARDNRCGYCRGTGTTPAVGPGVVRAHPVGKVVLAGAEPRIGERDGEPAAFAWCYRHDSEGASFLPRDVFRLLAGGRPDELLGTQLVAYPDHAAALDALSTACLAWARAAG